MPELIHHPGLSNEAYHALKSVSPSQIKVLGRSPLHYYDQFLAEDREKREPTRSRLGWIVKNCYRLSAAAGGGGYGSGAHGRQPYD